jgi:hypothetical protein
LITHQANPTSKPYIELFLGEAFFWEEDTSKGGTFDPASQPNIKTKNPFFFFFFSFFFFIWKTFGKTFFGEVDWGKGCSTRLIGPHPEAGLCLEHTLARH